MAAATSIFLELLAVTPPPPFFFSFGPARTWCHLSSDKSSCSLESCDNGRDPHLRIFQFEALVHFPEATVASEHGPHLVHHGDLQEPGQQKKVQLEDPPEDNCVLFTCSS